jgi:hypothetical protein
MSSSSSTASRCLKNCRREFRREFDELVGVEDDRPDEEELDRQNQIRYKNTIINLQRILRTSDQVSNGKTNKELFE